jgi:hypothetical protein
MLGFLLLLNDYGKTIEAKNVIRMAASIPWEDKQAIDVPFRKIEANQLILKFIFPKTRKAFSVFVIQFCFLPRVFGTLSYAFRTKTLGGAGFTFSLTRKERLPYPNWFTPNSVHFWSSIRNPLAGWTGLNGRRCDRLHSLAIIIATFLKRWPGRFGIRFGGVLSRPAVSPQPRRLLGGGRRRRSTVSEKNHGPNHP